MLERFVGATKPLDTVTLVCSRKLHLKPFSRTRGSAFRVVVPEGLYIHSVAEARHSLLGSRKISGGVEHTRETLLECEGG